ncbi:unnamed protein product [Brassica oleracea]
MFDRESVALPHGFFRRDLETQDEPRLLHSQLRHHCPRHPFPEPYLPPDLAPRLGHLGRLLDLPLLPPRRASRGVQPPDRRSDGHDLSLGFDRRYAFVHARYGECSRSDVDRCCVGSGLLVHAGVRRSDNLFLDEEAVVASEYSGLTSYPSS